MSEEPGLSLLTNGPYNSMAFSLVLEGKVGDNTIGASVIPSFLTTIRLLDGREALPL